MHGKPDCSKKDIRIMRKEQLQLTLIALIKKVQSRQYQKVDQVFDSSMSYKRKEKCIVCGNI